MKKLLAFLGACALGSSASLSLSACNSSHPHVEGNKQFVYHENPITNLGTILDNKADSIISAFKSSNTTFDVSGVAVDNITSNAAILNFDNDSYQKGTLRVTFNTLITHDISQLIAINTLLAGIIVSSTISSVQTQDVVDAINSANGLNLKLDKDISVKINSGQTTTAEVKAVSGGGYTGTITITLNAGLSLADTFSNNEIGNIYIPKEIIDKGGISFMALVMEFIGDANPIMANMQGLIAGLAGQEGLTVTNDKLTMDATFAASGLYGLFNDKVIFHFTTFEENRVTINDVFKNTNLKVPYSTKFEDIKTYILAQNADTVSKYDATELNRYLIITKAPTPVDSSVVLSWLPGSKIFQGHNPVAIQLSGVPTDQLFATITWSPVPTTFNVEDGKETGVSILSKLRANLATTYGFSQDLTTDKLFNYKLTWNAKDVTNDSDTIIQTEPGNDDSYNVFITITLKAASPEVDKDQAILASHGFLPGESYNTFIWWYNPSPSPVTN